MIQLFTHDYTVSVIVNLMFTKCHIQLENNTTAHLNFTLKSNGILCVVKVADSQFPKYT